MEQSNQQNEMEELRAELEKTREELKGAKKDADMYYEWYSKELNKTQKLEKVISTLKTVIEISTNVK